MQYFHGATARKSGDASHTSIAMASHDIAHPPQNNRHGARGGPDSRKMYEQLIFDRDFHTVTLNAYIT